MKKFLVLIPVLALVALPLFAAAQINTTQTFVENVTDLGAALNIINKVARWFMTIVVAISVIFFVFAGFLYVTSGGKEDKVKDAKNYLLYGIIGIAVALLAGAITIVVANLIGTSSSGR